MEEPCRTVDLELTELVCIEHTLTPSEVAGGAALLASRDLCLKIATALLEALKRRVPISVSLTESELWLLRERCSIYTSQGANADLGLVIKSKLYEAILSISNERAADVDLPTAEEPVRSPMEIENALYKFNRANRASPNDAGDKSDDKSATGETTESGADLSGPNPAND